MRVHVVGTSGVGKTTIARRIAARLGVPHTELDSIRHQADWVTLPDEDFVAVAREIASQAEWVVDGNYSVVRPVFFERATHIVWPDLPRWLILGQVFWRSLWRATTKRPMWNGNKERFRTWVHPHHPIRWAWSTFERRRREYGALASADPRWVRLRSRREIDEWIAGL